MPQPVQGIDIFNHTLPATASLNEILNLIKTLNNDERANGILVFLPLPRHLDTRKVVNAIAPEKDVDGQGAISVGRLSADESTDQLFAPGFTLSVRSTFLPCTPYGVMRMLEHYGIEVKGKKVVIVGKSLAVGKPLAMMMLVKEATVTVCHRGTSDLGARDQAGGHPVHGDGQAGPDQGRHGQGRGCGSGYRHQCAVRRDDTVGDVEFFPVFRRRPR